MRQQRKQELTVINETGSQMAAGKSETESNYGKSASGYSHHLISKDGQNHPADSEGKELKKQKSAVARE